MINIRSFQLKMTLWAVALSGSTLLLFVLGSSFYMRGEIEEFLSQDSRITSQLIFQLVEDQELLMHTLKEFESLNMQQNEEGDYEVKFAIFRVADPEGHLVYEYGDGLDAASLSRIVGKDGWYYYSDMWKLKQFKDKSGWTVILGANIHETDYEYIELLQVFFILLPIFMFILSIGSWTIGHRAVKPLKTLSTQITGVEASSLSTRVFADKGDEEVTILAHQINKMLDRIETAYAQVKRFNSDVSHELRTPLAVIQAELEDRLSNADLDIGEQQRSVRLLEEVSRLKSLTQSMLFLGRAEAGVWNEPKESFDLEAMLKDLEDEYREVFSDQNVSLQWNVSLSRGEFEGYPELMSQALRNLLQNAFKYVSESGYVRFEGKMENSELVMDVANTCEPLDPETQERIFDRFYRGDASRVRNHRSFGLGLNLAREMIHLHQGSLVLEKSDEIETVFRIRIPVA